MEPNDDARRNPQSNAPDTYDGPKTSPEGYVYVFGLRAGDAHRNEDPSKLYVIEGADGEPLRQMLYDGKKFSSAAEIGEYRRSIVAQGYTLAHMDEPDDRPGEAFPLMTPEETNRVLADLDKADADDAGRFANISEAQWYALKNRGWRHSALVAAGASPPTGDADDADTSSRSATRVASQPSLSTRSSR
jgi:hypothetical protein